MTDFCAISRRKEIELSIAKDQEKIDAIRRCMTSSTNMTTQMSGILSNFGTRLTKLEKAVIPVHRQTKDLQRLQDNLGKVITSIESVIGYHNVVKRNQAVINTDPKEHVVRYCTAMTDLLEAENFFKKSSPDSPELKKVSSLVAIGREKLLYYYETLLKVNVDVDDPAFVISSIKSGLSLDDGLTETALNELKKMSEWVVELFGFTSEFSDMYAKTREEKFSANVNKIRETARATTASDTPIKKNFTIRGSKTRKSIGKSFSRTLSMRSKGSVIQNETASPKSKRPVASVFDVYPMAISIEGFVKLCEREVKLATAILPESVIGTVIDRIVTNSIVQITLTSDKFLGGLNRTDNEEFSVFVQLCPLIQTLQKVQAPATHILQYASDENRRFISKILRNFESSGADVLQRYHDMVAGDKPKANLPEDATVHNLVSDAIHFLNSLEEYNELVTNMFTHTGKRQGGFAEYVIGLVGAIVLASQTKSFQYQDELRRKLFFLNNQHFIYVRLSSSNLGKHIQGSHEEYLPSLSTEEVKNREEFLGLWEDLKNNISLEGLKMETSKVSAAEKLQLKELFRTFNTKFTEFTTSCKTLSVPDETLRSALKTDLEDMLLNAYDSLWQAGQKKIDFTSKPTKYFLFTPEKLKEEIQNLFDPSL